MAKTNSEMHADLNQVRSSVAAGTKQDVKRATEFSERAKAEAASSAAESARTAAKSTAQATQAAPATSAGSAAKSTAQATAAAESPSLFSSLFQPLMSMFNNTSGANNTSGSNNTSGFTDGLKNVGQGLIDMFKGFADGSIKSEPLDIFKAIADLFKSFFEFLFECFVKPAGKAMGFNTDTEKSSKAANSFQASDRNAQTASATEFVQSSQPTEYREHKASEDFVAQQAAPVCDESQLRGGSSNNGLGFSSACRNAGLCDSTGRQDRTKVASQDQVRHGSDLPRNLRNF